MSDTWVVAARVRLKKKAVTAWLRGPVETPLGNRFDRLPELSARPKSVRHCVAEAADEIADDQVGGLIAAWDGRARSFLLYHVVIGWQAERIAATFEALAAAGQHGAKPFKAVLVCETAGRLWLPGVESLLQVDADGARFVGGAGEAAVLADLKPAEALWDRALDTGVVDAMHEPDLLAPLIRQAAKHPALAKRKRVVPTFDDAEAWLAAIRALRVADLRSFGTFEKEIPRWSEQVVRFGPDVAPALETLLTEAEWEPGVVAFWALNHLTRETGDPAFYLSALKRWSTWSEAPRGWARGEVTNEHEGAQAEHRAAVAGTPYEGWSILRIVRSIRG